MIPFDEGIGVIAQARVVRAVARVLCERSRVLRDANYAEEQKQAVACSWCDKLVEREPTTVNDIPFHVACLKNRMLVRKVIMAEERRRQDDVGPVWRIK